MPVHQATLPTASSKIPLQHQEKVTLIRITNGVRFFAVSQRKWTLSALKKKYFLVGISQGENLLENPKIPANAFLMTRKRKLFFSP